MGGADYQADPVWQRARRQNRRPCVWVALVLAGALLAGAGTSPGRAQPEAAERTAPGFPALPIHVTVATSDGAPTVDQAWLDHQVEMANRIFEGAGLSFVLAEVHSMVESHARLEDRRDRHALGALMHDDVINWFAVKSLRDVDDPSRMRMGVHWRPAGLPGKHFVIVASHSVPDVLAHELGHFFGNREHPETPGNVMSYSDGPPGVLPWFDTTQKRRIRRFARRFLQTREVLPAR